MDCREGASTKQYMMIHYGPRGVLYVSARFEVARVVITPFPSPFAPHPRYVPIWYATWRTVCADTVRYTLI
jgi:hypothetical protein